MRSLIHEIRNQLAVAIANVEAFRDGVLTPTPQRLAAVAQALADANRLLGELGTEPAGPSTRELATELQPINVCEVISNVVLAFEGVAREREIVLRVDQCTVHDPTCRDFLGDPVRIGEIVNNVMSNAIRYTPRGGRIEVDCRRAGGALTLSVADDGPGVRNDEIAKIFEAGFRGTAAANTEGAGLGLALATQFVKEHGGSIDVNNEPGHGARFTVRMPGRRLAATPQRTGDGTVSLI
ncbi:MAG: HAMP domain-containing sensor histidine kinase [Candidatus Velthaea sp.]|jgi:signal transduction histidine kinase